MDLRAYYRNLRELEGSIEEPFPVLASVATADGGREGTMTETPRWLAARMVSQGQARLATDAEAEDFRAKLADARRKAESEAAAAKVHLTFLTAEDLGRLKGENKAAEE